MASKGKICIIGSGLIGRNWAIIFSAFNYNVQLYDTNIELLGKAKDMIKQDLIELIASKAARSELSLEERLALISTNDSLAKAVSKCLHIQECVFEDASLKQSIFKQIDDLLEPENTETTIASSTSFSMPSVLFKEVKKHIGQCVVAHPINPPVFVRLVEIVRHSQTRADISEKVRNLMQSVGQKPVVLNKEVNGFAVNILQSALLHQAFGMIKDGIISAEDLDMVMVEGLAPRYAFIGPWMVAHLNADGIDDYFKRYAKSLYQVTLERKVEPIEGATANLIAEALYNQCPKEKLQEKRLQRDSCLRKLDLMKRDLN